LFICAKDLFIAADGNTNDRRTKSAANEINQNYAMTAEVAASLLSTTSGTPENCFNIFSRICEFPIRLAACCPPFNEFPVTVAEPQQERRNLVTMIMFDFALRRRGRG
jgi:hypothetical protein